MTDWIVPGKTMGLIGGSAAAYQLMETARSMGFLVGVYVNDRQAPIVKAADWAIIGEYDDLESLTELAFRSDFLVYETEELDPVLIETLQKTIAIPQGQEVLSIVQDRVLQKAYLEANSVNIAPYATIISVHDIQQAVKSIGYPCVLKTNRTDKQFNEHLVLYEEADNEKAAVLLEKGICVLEAMIPYERELQVTVVRNRKGEQIVYPVSEMIYREEDLYQVITPARIHEDVKEEVDRIARLVSQNLDVIGALSMELYVTATGTLYVHTLIFGPHLAGSYTIDHADLSHHEAHLRGVANWPLHEPTLYTPAIMMPFHKEHLDKTVRQITIHPDWHFHFYPNIEQKIREKETGFVNVPAERINRTLEQLGDIGLWED